MQGRRRSAEGATSSLLAGKGEVNITTLCEQEKVSDAWMSRVLRLAFLSPKITKAILTGTQPAGVDTAALLATRAVPAKWRDQELALLASEP